MMGTSRPYALSDICEEILKRQPSVVIDLGFGFGKYGFLAREYTDIWKGRYSNYRTTIIGVDAFYRKNPIADLIYDEFHIGKIQEVLPALPDADMVFFCDVIEHLSKEEGTAVLDLLKKKSALTFVSTPLRPGNRKGCNGNPFEAHISKWEPAELEAYGSVKLYKDHTLLLTMKGTEKNA